MMKIVYAVCILLAVVSPSWQEEQQNEADYQKCFPKNTLKEADPQLLTSKMIRSRLEFTIDFTREVLKRSKSGANLFFSPHSIYKALLLALFISDGKTESEIKSALRISPDLDKLDVLRSFQMEKQVEKWRAMNASVDYELNDANRFFYEKTLPVRPCMKTLFEEELAEVDFKNDMKQAKQFIDQWVSNQTRNQINDLLANADLAEDSKLVLVNAMYFKGLWQSKFLPENTKKDVFYITTRKNSLVSMMKQKSNFKHLTSEKLEAHVVEIPYKGEHVSMYIILPSFYHPVGIKHLLEKLTPDMIMELVEPNFMVERPVELTIPKFTVEKKLDGVISILESMGVKDLLQNSSDLSVLTGTNDVQFNDVVHKAKVSVDEEGTTAAASTAVFTFRSSRPLDPIKFNCNHPFIYFIYDHVTKSVLFIGMFNNPNANA